MTNLTSSIQVHALQTISTMAGLALTDTEKDESRDVLEQVARVADAALAMRSKDHSIAVDDVWEALEKRIRHFDRCIGKAVEDDPDDAIKIGNLLAGQHALKDFLTAIGSQSIEGDADCGKPNCAFCHLGRPHEAD